MKNITLILGGILLIVLVSGCTQTGQVIGPDDSGTDAPGDTVDDVTPPADQEPDESPANDRDYVLIKDIVMDPLLYKDSAVWVTGVLKQYYWAPDDYYVEDGQGYALKMDRIELYNFELNENYDVRARVTVNEYCTCEERKPIYLWKEYDELVVEECAKLGRCQPGSYKSYAGDPETYCICEVQQFFKYYWSTIGEMSVKECPTTEEKRCRQGSYEHDDPYLVVEQIEAA